MARWGGGLAYLSASAEAQFLEYRTLTSAVALDNCARQAILTPINAPCRMKTRQSGHFAAARGGICAGPNYHLRRV